MIAVDEDALRCDLAETYGIYDYESLPANLVAIFSCGLRETSRIKMKISEAKATTEILLLSSMVDSLNWLVWSKTRNGSAGINQPVSILQKIAGKDHEQDYQIYESGSAFDNAWKQISGKE